jgi:FixJ family two-component response regulator
MPHLVYLLGANVHDRAAISLATDGGRLRVQPIASIAELTPEAVVDVDAFLIWDDGNSVAQLRNHLSILAHRAPIIAIGEKPPVRQVVQALVSGAVDYLEWPFSGKDLLEAVDVAARTSARMLPLKHRALEARRRLDRLTRHERQILTAMAQGMSNKAIAVMLGSDPRMVEIARRHLLEKLQLDHSAEAIRLEIEASFSADWDRHPSWLAPWMRDAASGGTK